MNQVSKRSEKSSTFFGGSNFMKLNNYKISKISKIKKLAL